MELHGSQIAVGSIDISKLDVESLITALTSQVLIGDSSSTTLTNLRNRWSIAAQWSSTRAVTSNLAEPWKETAKSTIVFSVNIICLGSTTKQATAKDTGNVDLTATYKIYMFPTNGLDPSTEDTITYAGNTYRVVSVDALSPRGYPQLYIVGLV